MWCRMLILAGVKIPRDLFLSRPGPLGFLLSKSLCVRPPAPVTNQVGDYLETLYTRLSSQHEYTFLDKQEVVEQTTSSAEITKNLDFGPLIAAVANTNAAVSQDNVDELEKICLEKFTDWSRDAQLRVGFMLYLDKRINSKDYLARVIKHIGSGNLYDLKAHEVIALFLLIYFRRDWKLDDLCEIIDIGLLQQILAMKMRNKELSRHEVTAACLGLKRVEGLVVNNKALREELYTQFVKLREVNDELDDLFVVQVMLTLTKENYMFHDNVSHVEMAMKALSKVATNLSLSTAIKAMGFGTSIAYHDTTLTQDVLARIDQEFGELSLRDILGVCNFLSKTKVGDEALMNCLAVKLGSLEDAERSLSDLRVVLNASSFLAYRSVYDKGFINLISQTVNGLDQDYFSGQVELKKLDKVIAIKIFTALYPNSFSTMNIEDDLSTISEDAGLYARISNFLSQSFHLDNPGTEVTKIESSRAHVISTSLHSDLPMELYSPQMSTAKLRHRSRQLVNCYRGLVSLVGSEQYTRVVRILPHFPEPDIVFGHIGGIQLSVPHYMTDKEFRGPRPAPPGDWVALVMATRKTLDQDNEVAGLEGAKVRQLKALGYTPIVIPYTALGNNKSVKNSLKKLLSIADVGLPSHCHDYKDKPTGFMY